MKQITSVQNPYIKSLVLLQEKAKARKQSGTFLIEGQREISLAIKGGYEIDTILFYPELISEIEINKLMGMTHSMFKNIIALNTYTQPFLSTKQAEQREIIEQNYSRS